MGTCNSSVGTIAYMSPERINTDLNHGKYDGYAGDIWSLGVPWSRIGQDPVLVYLDRIFLLAEPATQVEGSDEDAVQKTKTDIIKEMEMKLLETREVLMTEMRGLMSKADIQLRAEINKLLKEANLLSQ